MNGSPQVLLLDPQQPEQTQLAGYLRRQGYLPLALEDPEALFPQFYRQAPAAIILADRLDRPARGRELCRQLKLERPVPVILLTDTSREAELYDCYASGADACLKRPVSLPLLAARLGAMLRRSRPDLQPSVQLGEYLMQPQLHLLTRQGKRVPLNPREYDLFCYLVEHKNQAFTRIQLLQAVWGLDYHGDTRTVDTHIKCLRKKLEGLETCLVTLHRVGYKFEWKEEAL